MINFWKQFLAALWMDFLNNLPKEGYKLIKNIDNGLKKLAETSQ